MVTERPSLRQSWLVFAISVAASILYFWLASVRYQSFRAGVDLGVFDQATWLISRGMSPFIYVTGFHILADHGAIILYPISLLQRIYPSVYWLLGLQAVALAFGAWPVWRLGRVSGLSNGLSLTVAVSYLLYPVIVGADSFDFHPDTLTVPALLMAILCARTNKLVSFTFWALLAMTTKEPMALAVAAMGVWLLLDRKTSFGCIAIFIGIAWFLFSTRVMIPHYGQGHQFNPLRYFAQFGDSYGSILKTIILKPWVPLRFILSKSTAIYFVMLLVPVAWGLSPRNMWPLIGALPTLGVNLLSIYPVLRSPFNQYSLAIVPFLFMSVILTLAAGRGLLQKPRYIAAWIITLTVLGIAARLMKVDVKQTTVGASNGDKRKVLDMVDPDAGLLTTHQIFPHLTHRKAIDYVFDPKVEVYFQVVPDDQIDNVLLDFSEDSLRNTGEYGLQVLAKYQQDPNFELAYHVGDLYLFKRHAK